MRTTCKGCGRRISQPEHRGRERQWCSELCRKNATYGGTCVGCGAPTSYTGRGTEGAKRCPSCATADNTIWTEATLIEKIKEWERLYGAPPTAEEWMPGQVRSLRRFEVRTRFDNGYWPYTNSVQRVFGSWNAGIKAAGFSARRQGERGPDKVAMRRRAA